MSQFNFLLTELHARTNTAILFVALAMMTLFNDKIDPLKKRILFIVFMASCIVSHYSTTYLFFFILLGTFIGVEILSKKYTLKKEISLTIMILLFAFIFFWYSLATEVVFSAVVRFIENVFSNFNRFFVKEIRSRSVHAVIGEGIWQKGIPYKIEFIFTWLTFAFIGIGLITLIRRYKEMSFPELNFKKTDFLMNKFEVAYFVAALVCSGLLVVVVAFPFISIGYGIDRVYFLGIVLLSVFFVIGEIIVTKYLNKIFVVLRDKVSTKNASHNSFRKSVYGKNASQVRAYLIILLVLIPYFLSATGVTYQVFGVPHAIILNSEGEQYNMLYVHDQESCSAMWLRSNVDEMVKIYTDYFGGLWLSSQGMVRSSIYDPSFIEDKEAIGEGYIFLRYVNVVDRKLLGRGIQWYNLTEYDHLFVDRKRIYDNGGSEAWR
ncbi:MAG: DUF2206 domain-containing protein [Candidatus Humimicrobiia bacterium]